MQRTFWITLLIFALALATAGCGADETPDPLPPLSLDSAEISPPTQVLASGVVVPARESQLAFAISGLVAEVPVKEGDQVQAGQALVLLETEDLELGVAAAESAVFSAEVDASLQRIRNREFRDGNFVYVSGPREQIIAADARVAQAQASLETARASLAQGILAAPYNSTVIEISLSPGEYTSASQPVVIVADLSNLLIETTDLGETDVARVATGQTAVVYVEALNQEFPGEVVAISPIANKIGGEVVFKVTVRLDQQPPALLWGMSADVEIETE